MSKTHGYRGQRTKEYIAWGHMIQRCTNPKHPSYKHYGGRGIGVCERWLQFPNFLMDVGAAPSPKHSLDRFPNNDGNYEPNNFRWATASEQAKNRRHKTKIEINGITKSLAQWSEESGVSANVISIRLKKGWHPGDAVFKAAADRANNLKQFKAESELQKPGIH